MKMVGNKRRDYHSKPSDFRTRCAVGADGGRPVFAQFGRRRRRENRLLLLDPVGVDAIARTATGNGQRQDGSQQTFRRLEMLRILMRRLHSPN